MSSLFVAKAKINLIFIYDFDRYFQKNVGKLYFCYDFTKK